MDAATLSKAMGGYVSLSRYKTLLPYVEASMRACGCTTVERAAMWLAQVGTESLGLMYMEEIASGAAYEGRCSDLGNCYPGDGKRFKGRGPIQLTGRFNYTKCSAWAYSVGRVPSKNYLVEHPEALEQLKYAFLGIDWYWTQARPMNSYADRRDIRGATLAVNGGTNGLADRTTRWNRCLKMGKAILPGPAAWRYDMPDFDGCWTVRRIQRNVGVPDDGVYGPATRDAVKKAQDTLGVKTDGLWGKKTQDAMVKAQRAGTYPRPEKTEPEKPTKEPTKKPWRYDMPTGGMTVKQVQRIVGVAQDGIYGKSTRAGVRKLQRKLRVKPRDGLWGKSTEKAWKRSQRKDNLLERGDRGRKVRKLQRKMNRVFPAYSSLTVDGIYGKSTERVIETFQRRANLTADGIVGPTTKRALARSGVKI